MYRTRRRRKLSGGARRKLLTDATIKSAVRAHDSPEVIAQYGPIEEWNTSKVTDMSKLFLRNRTFNRDISGWDVSNVSDMSLMFSGASSFNQPIGRWNMRNVQSIASMFSGATAFNQPLSGWMFDNLESMQLLFSNATSFNQNISSWDVSRVEDMSGVFQRAVSFNKPLANWEVANVKRMDDMFHGATSFNQPLANWDVENVESMASMFEGATNFNQDLSSWEVDNVEHMMYMFKNATSFNQDISSWHAQTALRTDMFDRATAFTFEEKTNRAWNPRSSFIKVPRYKPEEYGLPPNKRSRIEHQPAFNISIVAECLRSYLVSKGLDAELIFQVDIINQELHLKTCNTGCHCLSLSVTSTADKEVLIRSLRYPAPSRCALTGTQLLDAVKSCANKLGATVYLADESTKVVRGRDYALKIPLVSIIRHGKTWYERNEFVQIEENLQNRDNNEEYRHMTPRQLFEMSFDELRLFCDKRMISAHLAKHTLDNVKKKFEDRYLDLPMTEFFSDEFIKRAEVNEEDADHQRKVHDLADQFIKYRTWMVYTPEAT